MLTERSIESCCGRSRTVRAVVVASVLLGILCVPSLVEACAVCYGDADSSLTRGMNNGILVLLGIIAFVQIGFVALFVSIRQRAERLRRRKERFQVIQGGAAKC